MKKTEAGGSAKIVKETNIPKVFDHLAAVVLLYVFVSLTCACVHTCMSVCLRVYACACVRVYVCVCGKIMKYMLYVFYI